MGFSNNQAEYQGLLDALRWAEVNQKALEIKCDSKLVVNQVSGVWGVKHTELLPLVAEAFKLLHTTDSSIAWVRGHSGNVGNEAVDTFLNETLDKFQGKPTKRSKHG